MVGVPGRSKGCLTCRRRKVKCGKFTVGPDSSGCSRPRCTKYYHNTKANTKRPKQKETQLPAMHERGIRMSRLQARDAVAPCCCRAGPLDDGTSTPGHVFSANSR